MLSARAFATSLLVLALIATAGCGSGPGDSAGQDRAVKAVATTTQVGDLVRNVGGDRVAVTQILQPNADAHDYEPRPSDGRAVEAADVVFRSGADVDGWMTDLIESNGGGTRTVNLIESVTTRRGDGETDPHWWQDPRNAQRAVATIRDQLIEADPDGRDGYRRRADAYLERLRTLDARVARCIDSLPRDRRKLVTTHDALGYYTDRYGLTLVGAVIPAITTQAQPSSKDINDLVTQIRRQKVEAIFPEASLNPKLEKAVARESGAEVGGELWADALGPEGSKGATYIGSVQDNTATIVEGLSGGADRCRFQDR